MIRTDNDTISTFSDSASESFSEIYCSISSKDTMTDDSSTSLPKDLLGLQITVSPYDGAIPSKVYIQQTDIETQNSLLSDTEDTNVLKKECSWDSLSCHWNVLEILQSMCHDSMKAKASAQTHVLDNEVEWKLQDYERHAVEDRHYPVNQTHASHELKEEKMDVHSNVTHSSVSRHPQEDYGCSSKPPMGSPSLPSLDETFTSEGWKECKYPCIHVKESPFLANSYVEKQSPLTPPKIKRVGYQRSPTSVIRSSFLYPWIESK